MDPEFYNKQKLQPLVNQAPWVLRFTDLKGKPSPVLIIKQRKIDELDNQKSKLVEVGEIYGDSLRRCQPVIRQILSHVRDQHDVHLELQQFLIGNSISFRGNLPLDEQAGMKLGLLFRLQQRVKDLHRVELMANRIHRFTKEEAGYWLSRLIHFGKASSRWASAGMRIMLGGTPGDADIKKMLQNMQDFS